jgi:GPH family glycoside/pentoside/hexuronide:cation symporter
MQSMQLNNRQILAYSSGMAGWSILINLVSVMLIYIYHPPANSGLHTLIPTAVFLGIFSALALIAAGGRLFDAITDPLIAWMSDRSQHRRGRRIPFMRVGWIPAAIFCIAVFLPPSVSESRLNTIWLLVTLTLFYLFLTIYFIPYNALMPELAPTERDKVRLSTWLSLAYVMGLIIAAQAPLLASWIEDLLEPVHRIRSFQTAIGILALVAGILLHFPVISIDEKKYCEGRPALVSFRKSLGQTLSNYNFRLFLFADFSYFLAISIISSGMLYYLKVLLGLEEALGSTVFGAMILVSLLFYPLVLNISRVMQKKYLLSFGLVFLGVIFLAIFFLGKLPMPPRVQIYLFALLASLPLAILGIIPYAIIAEIAQLDGLKTGFKKEGMYFAVRNFFYKLGMTTGIMIFTIMTLWGKDPGNDLGIRLNGLVGFLSCAVAGITFLLFREKAIQTEIEELEKGIEKGIEKSPDLEGSPS